MRRYDVFIRIDHERENQILKYGNDEEQSIAGFLLIMQAEVNEAIEGWLKNTKGKHSVLSEVMQVAATATACLERHMPD